jgi:hypothetical protein
MVSGGVNGPLTVSFKEEIGGHLQGRVRGKVGKPRGSSMKGHTTCSLQTIDQLLIRNF